MKSILVAQSKQSVLVVDDGACRVLPSQKGAIMHRWPGMQTFLKGLLIFVMTVIMPSTSQGQGEVNFNNRVTGVVDARVTDACVLMVLGAGYVAQLFGGEQTSVEANLVPLFPTTTFRTSSTAALGYVIPVVVTVPGVESGQTGTLQMRVFDLAGQIVAKSNLIDLQLGGGLLPPSNLAGLQSFANPFACPEPSTWALAMMGSGVLTAAFALRRQRRD